MSDRSETSPRVLLDGIAFGECPRWHAGRLWFCDWAAEELLAVTPEGESELIANVRSFPFSIDWLPDGRLLVVSARQQALLTLEDDGTLSSYADLSALGDRPPGNEIVIDAHGRAYVDGGGFDLMAGEPPAPGTIALITPDGTARQVADDIAFGNGMAITEDGGTLIVAESYGRRLTAFDISGDGGLSGRRVWADLGEGTPDGICLDADGAVWYADVPNRRCVRVREGGEVLATIDHDRGCFACMLGGPAGTTLFIVARTWGGVEGTQADARTGQLLAVEVDVPHAGRP
jgi:sugar lactone lactonase YvrE